MKKFLRACMVCCAGVLVFVVPNLTFAADPAGKVTLQGTLISSACYLDSSDHPTGNDMGERKNCGSNCLKHGDPAGLVTKDNEFHVLVVSSILLAPYVGQQVRVSGNDHNGTITVEKVEVSKNGKWEAINLNVKNVKS
jgi:hypothetical protein